MTQLYLKPLPVGMLQATCTIVGDKEVGEAVIIDPGDWSDEVARLLEENGLTLKRIIHTHCHFDHIGGTTAFKERYKVPVAIPRGEEDWYMGLPRQAALFGFKMEAPTPYDELLEDGQVITAGGIELTAIATPGHSPAHLCFQLNDEGGTVVCGDTVFYGSIGRTDLPGAHYETLIRSIKERLLVLPDETVLIPGHGPSTTVGHERKTNPFLQGM